MLEKIFATALTLTILLATCTPAATIYVDNNAPADFNNIQSAINTAQNGDTIIVKPGTYRENIDFSGKAVTLRSTDPNDWTVVEATIIDANASGSCVVFDNNEDPNSILEGLTLTNGAGTFVIDGRFEGTQGGAVRSDGASPIIRRCLIRDNMADSGGGVYCEHGTPSILDCMILRNEATYGGGGIESMYTTFPRIADCYIAENSAKFGGGFRQYASEATLTRCTITHNKSAEEGGGLHLSSQSPSSACSITDCIIAANVAGSRGDGLYCGNQFNVRIARCTFARQDEGVWVYEFSSGIVEVTHSILWDTYPLHPGRQGTPSMDHCIVPIGWESPGKVIGGQARTFTTTPTPTDFVLIAPADNATGVSDNPTLTWEASKGAESYKVYFGRENPPPLHTTVPASADPTITYRLGKLWSPARYYWRVDAVNRYEVKQGFVWNFTTEKDSGGR